MNLIEDRSSGLPIFHPEPGTSLANAIGKRTSSLHFNEAIQPISSMISNTESNHDSDKQSLNETDNQKYKTELCRNYSAYGFCSYSTHCQFAHGHQELRCRTRHPKYKTEFCRNFLSGHCKYGSRCQFLHQLETMQPTDLSTPATTYPAAVTAIGTYLLSNMLAQSAIFGLGGSIAHQSALATLAACVNLHSNTSPESSRRRAPNPFHCGMEMQQLPRFHGTSIPQNQNNNDSSLQSAAEYHSQSCTFQAAERSSEDIKVQPFNHLSKRMRNSSAHI